MATASTELNENTRRLTSPEQLNDYLHVTTPQVWVLLVAVILSIAGFLIWSNSAVVESYATATVQAQGGELTVLFDDSEKGSRVQAGMTMQVGDVSTELLTVGKNDKGDVVASARANIPDGAYEARVGYDTTQVWSMLFN